MQLFYNKYHRNINYYLDRPDIRSTIGVDPSLTANFSTCNNDVGMAFGRAQDFAFPAQLYIAALLERGVRALIYVGANDWICNWVRAPFCALVLRLTGALSSLTDEFRVSRWVTSA